MSRGPNMQICKTKKSRRKMPQNKTKKRTETKKKKNKQTKKKTRIKIKQIRQKS